MDGEEPRRVSIVCIGVSFRQGCVTSDRSPCYVQLFRLGRVRLNEKSNAATPESIVELHRQFEQFRSSHVHRPRIPGILWSTAVEQARKHGLPLNSEVGIRARCMISSAHTPALNCINRGLQLRNLGLT